MSYFIKTNEEYQNTLTTWCYDANIEEYGIYASVWNTDCRWLFEFKRNSDATAFKLKWGC